MAIEPSNLRNVRGTNANSGQRSGASFLSLKNQGPFIVETNYWSTPHAKAGYVYVSINARAFRVLVPRARASWLAEMATAKYVIATRGTWHGLENALELLFEDNSKEPFVLLVVPQMMDRILPRSDEGRVDLKCLVYTEGPTLQFELPCRYRSAKRLPYLKKWA